MPQLDPAIFVPQLFWLFVSFLVLFVLMKLVAVPQVGRAIELRRQRLEADLGAAAQRKTEAEAALAAYEQVLANARAEAQAVLRETAQRMAAEASERQHALAAILAEQVGAAEQRIAAAKEASVAEIRSIAVEVGRAVVEKLTGTMPDAARMTTAVDDTLGARVN